MTLRTSRRSWIRRATFARGSSRSARGWAPASAPRWRPRRRAAACSCASPPRRTWAPSCRRWTGWASNVRWVDTTARLLVVESPVLSAASVVALLQLPARLLGIQALETNLLCAVGGRHGGSQSQAAVCSDELVFSSMPYQPGLGLVGATPPATGNGPLVAVLDGGFSLHHEALPPHAIAGTYDTFDGDTCDRGRGRRHRRRP